MMPEKQPLHLNTAEAELVNDVLARRNPSLYEQVRYAGTVSRSDAEQIMSALSDELANNLDDDWEPTDYGDAVSAALAQFNAARVSEWP